MSREESSLFEGDGQALADIERAIYLTRAGKHSEARDVYQRLRSRGDFGADADASLMLMLLDGLIHYYQDRNLKGAVDRLYRTRALGRATSRQRIVSLACSWLSHCYFNSGDFDLMFQAIDEALTSRALEHKQAAVRLLITIADAHSLAGDFLSGRKFYDSARAAAVALGDTLSISAAAHNRSTLALSHVRFSAATGVVTSSSAQAYLNELLSAARLETYLDQSSVLYPYEIWVARSDLLNAQFESALSKFNSVLEDRAETDQLLRLSIMGESAYCYLKLSDSSKAVELIDMCLKGEVDSIPSDDRAVLYSIAVSIFDAVGQAERRVEYDQKMRLSRDTFVGEIEELNLRLADLRSRL